MNVKIDRYQYDGACWQAQAVLAYLRSYHHTAIEESWNSDKKRYDAEIYCGRYENCREQGYVFSLYYNGNVRHYAVYEHRNSDDIIVLISTQHSINTPSIETMWKDKGENASKYDYDKEFSYDEIIDCGEWIIKDMQKHLSKWIQEEKKEDESI